MGRQEGIDLLLHAARIVVHGYGREDVHFALVGGGTSLEELRALAHELGIAQHVTFTGRVPDAELLAVLNTADVCVNPDRACALNELSTMNKVLEYMALGKPVVQFDLKEGRASAGEAALYARPDDPVDLAAKLVELIDDAPRRAGMGRLGRARVERELEWRLQAPRLLAAYAGLQPGAAVRRAGREVET
jgi:glycosyltransferase involved in cell wall biosynthesis